jgi:hypothetical protein
MAPVKALLPAMFEFMHEGVLVQIVDVAPALAVGPQLHSTRKQVTLRRSEQPSDTIRPKL